MIPSGGASPSDHTVAVEIPGDVVRNAVRRRSFVLEAMSDDPRTVLSPSSVVASVVDDEDEFTYLSILNQDLVEGGASPVVRLTGSDGATASFQTHHSPVTATWRTRQGSARRGAHLDFTGETGDVTIPSGSSSATLTGISIRRDGLYEPEEAFVVDLELSSSSYDGGVRLADGSAVITIAASDSSRAPSVTLSRLSPRAREGGSARFRLELSGGADVAIDAEWDGEGFGYLGDEHTFAAGAYGASLIHDFGVLIAADGVYNNPSSRTLRLSGLEVDDPATSGTRGAVTVEVDDDFGVPTLRLEVFDSEGSVLSEDAIDEESSSSYEVVCGSVAWG